ncbi:MAG: glycosyltransferase N-terminal domain-containing protein, partial [Bacteroidota bacterium]|nr:glycosyltransferase N-terminal domain-containing protein [Bacteroidota bacterium]
MRHLYSLLISLFHLMLPVLGVYIKSLKEFYQVRRGLFKVLEENLSAQDQTIWVHAASLGEYEQAVPVLEELRAKY